MDHVVETIFHRLRREYTNARDLLARLDPALLHVAPSLETNSIAALLHHLVGAEMQIVRQVAGLPAPRDRDAEFRITSAEVDRATLEAELDAADRLLDDLGPRIGPEQLAALVERSGGRVFTGLHWLISAHGHACEHLGEAEVTAHWLRSARDG